MAYTILLFVSFTAFLRVLQAHDLDYTAAVVEYYPLQDKNLTAAERLEGNAENYLKLLDTVKESLDIVVFPESTLHSGAVVRTRDDIRNLSTEVPAPSENIAPCDETNYPNFFKLLSATARTRKTYFVVNLMERAICDPKIGTCAVDGWNLYNTDVAFDRNGVVVARYRKYNLFGEYPMNKTATPEVVKFTTDFGVTFGVITCFDILFFQPALQLVKDGVKNVIFPTMWFSELPFLTALQTQQMWSIENDVTFLSAGANNPKLGSGGTGIFAGKAGPYVFDIKLADSTIMVKNITKSSNKQTEVHDIDSVAKQMDGFTLLKDNLTSYTTRLLNMNDPETFDILCSGDDTNKLCCEFSLTTSVQANVTEFYYRYRLVAFSGVRSFSWTYNGGIEACGIVACLNDTQDSCGMRFPNYSEVAWPVTFEKIEIRANFTNAEHKIQFPNSLSAAIRPLSVDKFEWSSQVIGDFIERSYRLIKPCNRLYTFAIYGRDFSRDNDPNDKGSAGNLKSNLMILIVFLMLGWML